MYERDKCILKNIDILFAKSSKTAIIGRNGSGKTTIINLLTRMYEPTSGEILLGSRKYFRAAIARIPKYGISCGANKSIYSMTQ